MQCGVKTKQHRAIFFAKKFQLSVAPHGFEPQLTGSEPIVLPLDDGASSIH